MIEELIAVEDFATFFRGGPVGDGRSGGQCVERTERNISDLQGELGSCGCGQREATAFDCGEALPDHIDFMDAGPAGHQCFMEGDGVVERNGVIEGELEDGAAAAADEEEDEGASVGTMQHAKSGAGCLERLLIGPWVTGMEVADAPVARGLFLRTGADSAEGQCLRKTGQQGIQHGRGGFAEGDDPEMFEGVERDADCRKDVLKTGIGVMDERGVFKMQMAIEGFPDVAVGECRSEDVARAGMQLVEL